jgi:hypothetical protein
MVRSPEPGTKVWANYKYKFLPYQGCIGTVLKCINHGCGPRNIIVKFEEFKQPVIIPGGNLNKFTEEHEANGLPHYAK